MTKTYEPEDGKTRCSWCLSDPLYVRYHDEEWGVPCHDETRWFEMLILEGAQAGLSWFTILRRREAYRAAYADWDPEKVARFGKRDVTRLLSEKSGIVRNRLKVAASINNAARFLDTVEEWGSFDAYMWHFTDGQVIVPQPRLRSMKEIRCTSPEGDAMSKDLKKRGFRFVGPLICHAHMQACGMVDEHLADCFRTEPE